MRRVRIFRYVGFDDLDAYLDLGWYFDGENMLPHGAHGVILEWLCDCPCREPSKAQ